MRTKRFRTLLASIAVMLCMLLAVGAQAKTVLSYHKLGYRPVAGADTLGAMPSNYSGTDAAGTDADPHRLVFYPSMDSLMGGHNSIRTLTANTYSCGEDFFGAFSQNARDQYLHVTSTSASAIKITFTPNSKTKDYISRLAIKNRADVDFGKTSLYSNNDYIFFHTASKEFAQITDSGRVSIYDEAAKKLKITYTPGETYFQSNTTGSTVQGSNVITVTYTGVNQVAKGDAYIYEFSAANSASCCAEILIEGLNVKQGQVVLLGVGNASPKWNKIELTPVPTVLSYNKLNYRPEVGADTLGAMPDNYTGATAATGTNADPFRLVFYPSMDSIMGSHNSVRGLTASTYGCASDYYAAFSQNARDLYLHATSTAVSAVKITFTPNSKTKDYISRLAIKNRADVDFGKTNLYSNNDYIFFHTASKEFAQITDSGRVSVYDEAAKKLKITYTPGETYFQSNTTGSTVQGSNVITVTYTGVNQVAKGDAYIYEFSAANSASCCAEILIEGLNVKQGQVLLLGVGNASPKWSGITLNPYTEGEPDVPASSIEITGAPATAVTGVQYTLGATVLPKTTTDKSVTWSVVKGNEFVKSLNAGKIVAQNADKDTVVVRVTSVSTPKVFKDVTLVFNAYVKADAFAITGIPAEAVVGGSYTLGADVTPATASYKAPTWSITSGSAKASITSAGVLTPTDTGTIVVRATITAPLAAGSESTTVDSTIKINPVVATGVKITDIPAEMVPGGQYLLGADVLPANTTYKAFEWSIQGANTIGATITEAGVLSATAVGSVTVRAKVTFGGALADSVVTFKAQPVESVTIVGNPAEINPSAGTLQLFATILPEDATDKSVTWSKVSGPGSIDANGLITFAGEGTLVVKATSVNNPAKTAQVSIIVSSSVVSVKQEVLVVYENFGGHNKVGEIQPAAWPMLYNPTEPSYADRAATKSAGAWRRTAPDTRFVGYNQTEYSGAIEVPGMTDNPERPGEIAGVGAVWTPWLLGSFAFEIDTIKKYSGLNFPEYTFDVANPNTAPFTYGVPLRNGYILNGAATMRIGMQNIAVAPDFHNIPCYDTTLTKGGKFTVAVDQPGWEKSFEVPANSTTCNTCNQADRKGYLQFGGARIGWKSATDPGIPGTLMIPAEGTLNNVSKVEFSWASAQTFSALVAQVEYYNNAGALLKVDTLNYASNNYAFRDITLPVTLDANGNNKIRVKLTSPFSDNNGRNSFRNFEYQFNDPADATNSQATVAIDPFTFSRYVATTTLSNNNMALRLFSLKVYAMVEATGYTITASAGVTGKTTGIGHGEVVSLSAAAKNGTNKSFRGWRISGMDDLTEVSNPLLLTVTGDVAEVTPLYAGDSAIVAVVNENFRDWEQVGVDEVLPGDAAAGMIKMARNVGAALSTYGLSETPVVKRMPLRYGFKTPSGGDFVDVTMKYINVAPNATIRIHNVPGAESYKGFVAFSSVADNDKGYFEIAELNNIEKAVVQLSSPLVDNGGTWGANVRAAAQPALAFFDDNKLVRNVTQLKPHYVTNAEIPFGGASSKITIGFANNAPWETFSRDRMGTPDTIKGGVNGDSVIYGATLKGLVTSKSYRPAYPSTSSETNNRASSFAAMHSLKLYAKIELPEESSDATLSSFEIQSRKAIGDVTLDFTSPFAPTTYTYTVANDRLVDSVVIIKAEKNNPNATITGDIGTKTLKVGDNIYKVKVFAENGDSLEYAINVKRIVLNTDATLKSLTASGIVLTPNFNPNTTTYTSTVAGSVSSTTITGVANSTVATVVGNGEKTLNVGVNSFKLKVVAEDTLITKDYTINILRQKPNDETSVGAEDYTVKLYPNPATAGELTVENSEWKEGTAIEIFDLNGTLIVTYMSTSEKTTLNVSQLPNGAYMLKAGNKVATKFVVNKQ